MSPEIANLPFAADASLISYHKLENVNDSGPNAYHLSDHNSVTYVAGRFGNAARFVAASSKWLTHVETVALKPTGSFTLCGWMKIASLGSNLSIVSHFDSGGNGYRLQMTSANKLRFDVGGLSAARTSNITLTTGLYYFWAGRFNVATGDLSVFINGDKDAGVVTGTPTYGGATPPFAIGADYAAGGDTVANYFDGDIDDVAFFSRALTDTELMRIFRAGANFLPFL